MRTSRLFAPLALVGVLFVAVAVALFFYAAPWPLWTTNSPKIQGDYEFLGVYRGMPRHLAKRSLMGSANPYTGDLWAYFRVNKTQVGEIFSRIKGASGSETAYVNEHKFSFDRPKDGTTFIAVPLPSQYPNELRNGQLELSDGTKTLGAWSLHGMAPAKQAIDPKEPDKLQAEAMGLRLEIAAPLSQNLYRRSDYFMSAETNWTTDLKVTSRKLDPRDRFEYRAWLNRTCWSSSVQEVVYSADLPVNSTDFLDIGLIGCLPSKRIEIGIKVIRYRVAPDSITLHNVVIERDRSMPPGHQGFRLIRCSDRGIVSKNGIAFELHPSSASQSGSQGGYAVGLICREPLGKKVIPNSPLSKKHNVPIDLLVDSGGVSTDGTKWDLTFWGKMQVKSSSQTVKLSAFTVNFFHKAVLEEKMVYFLAPTK